MPTNRETLANTLAELALLLSKPSEPLTDKQLLLVEAHFRTIATLIFADLVRQVPSQVEY